MNKRNLILIGMPSSGKSTIGVVLAKVQNRQFIDTDLVMQQREKRRLQEIINTDGLARFLEGEEAAILSITADNAIISTGGSAIYSEKAMAHLRQQGTVIYLKLPYSQIKHRLHNLATRGVALENGQTLKQLFDYRTPLYEKFADITIDCTAKSIEHIVNEIDMKTK